jgi:hypothetical protein
MLDRAQPAEQFVLLLQQAEQLLRRIKCGKSVAVLGEKPNLPAQKGETRHVPSPHRIVSTKALAHTDLLLTRGAKENRGEGSPCWRSDTRLRYTRCAFAW